MPSADVDQVKMEIENRFGIDTSDVIGISAKTGQNVQSILDIVIQQIEPPSYESLDTGVFKGYLVDSWYEHNKGVVMLIQVRNGVIKKNDQIISCHNNNKFDIFEVGILHPE